MNKTYDAIVIGAGMSGLAAAIRLSLMGKKICLLEKHSKSGGLNSYFARGKRSFDTGLHAVTNYFEKKEQTPLRSILKQLRIPLDALNLSAQKKSRIHFPQANLSFTNNIEDLKEDISSKFPQDIDGLCRLLAVLPTYAQAGEFKSFVSTNDTLKKYINESLLREMLCYPVYSYGNARENDMNFSLFSMLFRSIYLEGLSRPTGGIRSLLQILQDRLSESGGELRLRCPVEKIDSNQLEIFGVYLKNGEYLQSKAIYSSIGLPETHALLGQKCSTQGKVTLAETTFFTEEFPKDLGFDDTMIFYNELPHYTHKMPEDLVDKNRAVICLPNNFLKNDYGEGVIKVTQMANYNSWHKLPKDQYKQKKEETKKAALLMLKKIQKDFNPTIKFTDMFTPTTIERYTGHYAGTVYGGSIKSLQGTTSIKGLYICGNDQGQGSVGITGAMLSGILMANRYG